jgi:hypothetical protein
LIYTAVSKVVDPGDGATRDGQAEKGWGSCGELTDGTRGGGSGC